MPRTSPDRSPSAMTPPRFRRLAPLVLATLLIAGAVAWAQRGGPDPESYSAPGRVADLTPDELANIRVYEAANSSVVHITTKHSPVRLDVRDAR